MDKEKKKNTIGAIVVDNIKTVFAVFSFIIALYAQNEVNSSKIADLQRSIEAVEDKQQEAYNKIDEIKLDKAVFSATVSQLQPMREDLQELRADIKEILKSINHPKK